MTRITLDIPQGYTTADRLKRADSEMDFLRLGLMAQWARLSANWEGRDKPHVEAEVRQALSFLQRTSNRGTELGTRLRGVVQRLEEADKNMAMIVHRLRLSGDPRPPKIYIIDGIGVDSKDNNDMSPDEYTKRLKEKLIEYGYAEEDIVVVPAVYNTDRATNFTGTNLSGTNLSGTNFKTGNEFFDFFNPINLFTGAAASTVNAITGAGASAINNITGSGAGIINEITKFYDMAMDSGDVYSEYIMGENGTESSRLISWIKASGNLPADGQGMVFIAHSGGGAIAPNVASYYSRQGYHIESIMTMGSPILNLPLASQVADTVVEIRHDGDLLGNPITRSMPSPTNDLFGLLKWGGEMLFKDFNKIKNDHGAYWSSTDVLHILQNTNPNIKFNTLPNPTGTIGYQVHP